jgi:O-acetyl-ADP-ribose deacetylase (regulator of RNase III)
VALQIKTGPSLLSLILGDITRQDTDAIVNAANSGLLGGGGVDGAIHRAGGPQILEECREIRKTRGGCPTGDAVITSGGRLKARYVIHTVGPVWQGGTRNEETLLRNAYENSLKLAVEHGVQTVSFPSISTGVYGFPIERASRIAFDAVRRFVEKNAQIREVRFIMFSQDDFDIYAPLFSE